MTMNTYLAYFLKLSLLTFCIAVFIWVVNHYLFPTWVHEEVWSILIFFSLFTLVTGIFVLYLMGLSKENISNILLGASVLRLLGSAAFFAIMMMLGISNEMVFVVNFFIVYLSYLLFDMFTLITNLRPNLK
jgi:hypothetical protein